MGPTFQGTASPGRTSRLAEKAPSEMHHRQLHQHQPHAVVIVYWQASALQPWLWDFPSGRAGPGTGLPLGGIYAAWLAVVLLLFPVCRWDGRLKRREPHGWLRFL